MYFGTGNHLRFTVQVSGSVMTGISYQVSWILNLSYLVVSWAKAIGNEHIHRHRGWLGFQKMIIQAK